MEPTTQPNQYPPGNLSEQPQTIPSGSNDIPPEAPINNNGDKPRKKILIWIIISALVIILIITVMLVVFTKPKKVSPAVTKSTACAGQNYVAGSTGPCVSDIQTMVNFIETDGLNECSFKGNQLLTINGNFDQPTVDQVKVVQNWLNCYNKQEGAPGYINPNGMVGSSTWSGLCTYAYYYPKQAGQSNSSYFKATLAAGKTAGC